MTKKCPAGSVAAFASDGRTKARLLVTAYHEAGHAVAAHILNIPMAEASIEPGEFEGWSTLGHVSYSARPEGADPQAYVTNHLITTYAGPAAQRTHRPRSRIPAGAMRDMEQVSRSAFILCRSDDGRRALLRWAAAEARALVKREWRSIEVLAHALVERITIPGDETHEIIARVQKQEGAELRAAFELMKAEGSLPSEEEYREIGKRERRRLHRGPLNRSHVASALLRVTLDAMHPELTKRHDVDYLRGRLQDVLWGRGFPDEEIRALLDTLIQRQWQDGCGRPRLLFSLPIEEA